MFIEHLLCAWHCFSSCFHRAYNLMREKSTNKHSTCWTACLCYSPLFSTLLCAQEADLYLLLHLGFLDHWFLDGFVQWGHQQGIGGQDETESVCSPGPLSARWSFGSGYVPLPKAASPWKASPPRQELSLGSSISFLSHPIRTTKLSLRQFPLLPNPNA